MSGDISSWQKTKDLLLIGAAGLVVLGIGALLSLVSGVQTDLAALKTQVAVYQANLDALKADHMRLAAQVDQHFRDDRERFKASTERR